MYKPNYLASATAGFSCAETKATNRAAKTMLRNILLKLYFKLYKQSDFFTASTTKVFIGANKETFKFFKTFFLQTVTV